MNMRTAYHGQVSVEYLLLLAAFFAALGIILPSVAASTNAFLSASDSALAKHIATDTHENVVLLSSMGNNSSLEEEYVPSQKITLYSKANTIVVSAGKEFAIEFPDAQVFVSHEFKEKFVIRLTKENGKVVFHAEEVS